jgi:O-antigen ligase
MARDRSGFSYLSLVSTGLLFLLWLFLPMQLGKHLWLPFSLVNGIRVDYLAPTLYGTDLLVGSLILIQVLARGLPKKKDLIKVGVIMTLLLLPILWVDQPALHGYGLVKLGELVGLFWAAGQVRLAPQKKLIALLVVLCGLSLLVMFQVARQGAVGGGWYWLGERSFTATTPGIAQAQIGGRLWLRPYGTFSHPNSLAGFVLVLWWLGVDLFTGLKPQVRRRFQLGLVGAGALTLISLLLLWSRTAWVVALVTVGLVVGRWQRKPGSWGPFTVGVVGFGLALPALTHLWLSIFPSAPESFQLRDQLSTVGVNLFIAQPIFGVGIKGFIPQLAHWQLALSRAFLQPIHNGFWLVLVETGLVGFVGLVFGLVKTTRRLVKNQRWGLWLAWLAVLLLAANDHYWITLQQNQLLLALLLVGIWHRGYSQPIRKPVR